MFRVIWGQVLRRRGRSAAVILAIVLASSSFALLTSAVATSKLEVQGTVEANYRSAYDILVRPAPTKKSEAGTAAQLERSQGLVQANYLSGIYGGISMDQLDQIREIPGVEVAAPVAMIGYTLPAVPVPVVINDLIDDDPAATDQLFRLTMTWSTDRGLTSIPAFTSYQYFTRRSLTWQAPNAEQPPAVKRPGDKPVLVCQRWAEAQKAPRNAFDVERMRYLSCDGSNPPRPNREWDGWTKGDIGFTTQYRMPMLIAAIDPVEEAKLVGLDDAVVFGRYLTADDHTRAVKADPRQRFKHLEVPVLMAQQPLTDDRLTMQVQRLQLPEGDALTGLSGKHPADWAGALPGQTVRTLRVSDRSIYKKLLRYYRLPGALNSRTMLWRPGNASYAPGRGDAVAAEPTKRVKADTYDDGYGGYSAPAASGDVGFRRLSRPVFDSQMFQNGTYQSPNLDQVGIFDASRIIGFSELSKVPLTTYYPPDAAPGNARTERLLGGRSLLPNGNLTGYLQQPPTILTTIKSLPTFNDPNSYPQLAGLDFAESIKRPLSVVRIRVAGVTGTDDTSRERVRLVAEQIARRTGLSIDVTVGSSPIRQQVVLPAGDFGRPELTLSEGWVKKGVAVRLLSSIDTKSLALFALMLLVCVLFIGNATLAAVRTRRAELGVLACLGWPARRIFAMLQAELLLTGVVAGALGTAVASIIVWAARLDVTWWHLALITPVATLLAGLSGLWPAWQASRATPIDALRDNARPPRSAGRRVATVTGLALTSLRRLPGRTFLGAASLLVGVAALTTLIALQSAFRAGAEGTALGDVISVQVRGVDYLAAAVTIALGAFAVADIAYLNIAERTAEIGTLRSVGWSEGNIRRLFATEAFTTAFLGAASGAALAVAATAFALPVVPITTSLQAAALALTGGTLAAMIATTGPVARLHRIAPAAALSE